MDWLVIALLSYFVLAIVGIADKFLLSNIVKDNRIYVFLIGVLGLLVFLASPFVDFSFPGISEFLIDFVAGVFLIAALFLFYKALQTGEASIVIPLIGGGMPVIVFILSVTLLGKVYNATQLSAVLFLILGGILISLIPKEKRHWWELRKPKVTGIGVALASTVLFACYFVLSDYTYETQGFANGFIWSRIGSFVAVVWLVFDKSFQKSLRAFFQNFIEKKKYIFFINQTFGAVAFLGQGYAISLKGAAIINALQGVQYVFLLVMASVFSVVFPKLIKERVSKLIIFEKAVAIVIIGIGVYLITK